MLRTQAQGPSTDLRPHTDRPKPRPPTQRDEARGWGGEATCSCLELPVAFFEARTRHLSPGLSTASYIAPHPKLGQFRCGLGPGFSKARKPSGQAKRARAQASKIHEHASVKLHKHVSIASLQSSSRLPSFTSSPTLPTLPKHSSTQASQAPHAHNKARTLSRARNHLTLASPPGRR